MLRLGDKVEGWWRTLSGRVRVTGTLVSASHGFVTLALDAPVEFRPGDVRTRVSWGRHEADQWRSVARGPELVAEDVTGSFHCQALTPAGLIKCGVDPTETR